MSTEGTTLIGEFQGTPVGVRSALSSLRDHLEGSGVPDDAVHSVEIVVAEALNNVVEHALKDEDEPAFQMAVEQLEDAVAFEIRDCGLPMPNNRLPEGNLPDMGRDVLDLPEGGFGWYLIRTLTKDLRYERAADENRLTFRMSLSD